MTNWIEVSLKVDGEAAEAIADVLQRYGHQGVVIEQDELLPDLWDETELPPPDKLIVRAYFPANETMEDTKLKLETALGHMNMIIPIPQPTYKVVNEVDWAEAWKAHYKPLRIGKKFLIQPAWLPVEPNDDDIVLILDPGMAFGTGTHPTTQLCLESLEDQFLHGVRTLDLGCGSGILSIGAAKLGAIDILALDIDPIAVRSTVENATRNHVNEKITAQQGSLETVITSSRRFDFVMVNILAKIIIKMCENNLGDVVRPGGKAIFSGMIEDQVIEVREALERTGLTVTHQRQQQDWVLLETIRQPK